MLGKDIQRQKFKFIIKPYLNIMKDCGFGNEYGSCVYNPISKSEKSDYLTYNGNELDTFMLNDGQLLLNDGAMVYFENWSSGTNYITVDVNGYEKKPNRLGRDLFMFEFMPNGELVPMGAKGTKYYSDSDEYCSSASTDTVNGAGCTAKALKG